MSAKRPRLPHLAVALCFAASGISKLAALKPQRELFASWGWTEEDMKIIGAAELGGAMLLVTPHLAKFGAALLTATSICIAITEVRHRDNRLVTPRLAMLAAAAASGLVKGPSA